MKSVITAMAVALTLSLWTYASAQTDTSDVGESPLPGVTLTVDIPTSDDVLVADASITGDVLTLTATYACGCSEHTFDLVWDGAFAESLPVQVWLHFVHDAHGEVCERACTTPVQFDLTNLRAAYIDGYLGGGTIRVHVAGSTLEYTFDAE